jgi:hypothetical protein
MESKTKVIQNLGDASFGFWESLDIKGRVKRNPYGLVAGALGLGFVLGGGLFTRISATILGAGLRLGLLAALPVLEKKLLQTPTPLKSETNKGD